jgi:hypothetical protein
MADARSRTATTTSETWPRLSTTDLSVVVCAYTTRRWNDLQRAVASIEAQQPAVGEVVVVVDHNDELLAAARRRWPQHPVVASTGRPGLSGARDTGIERSTGELIAFLDDDAAAAPGWAAALVEAFDGTPGAPVLGVGGLVRPVWATARPRWWPAEFDWVVGCSYVGLPAVRAPVRNPIGANMAVRRRVVTAVGGFDPRVGRSGSVPTGCEETEFFIRAARAHPAASVLLEPGAPVDHHVPADRATLRYFVRRCFGEGVSKRIVARIAGPQQALSSERTYVSRTLPRAVATALRERRPGRAGAVVLGLSCTVAGYVRETLRR